MKEGSNDNGESTLVSLDWLPGSAVASAFNSLLTERILKGDKVRKDEGTRNLVSDWLAASLPRNYLKFVFLTLNYLHFFTSERKTLSLSQLGKKEYVFAPANLKEKIFITSISQVRFSLSDSGPSQILGSFGLICHGGCSKIESAFFCFPFTKRQVIQRVFRWFLWIFGEVDDFGETDW